MIPPNRCNPWKSIRKLMDAVPEERRRLLRFDSWRSDLDCGCVFGTIYPSTPRIESSRINFRELLRKGEGAPGRSDYEFLVEPFTTWAHGLGLTLREVTDLQRMNDYCDATPRHDKDVRVARWELVYAYVVQKEEAHDRDFPEAP